MNADITASVTATATISLGHTSSPARPAPVDNPTHASTSMQNGQAVFENDNYKITADDNNTVTIHNKNTGETYKAEGDPHFSVDGQHAFDFWGTTTFKLDDGTKVTIQTTPSQNNPGQTLSSKVTITNGDYGVQITGVDSDTKGDLQIHEAEGWGKTLDWAVDDGNKLQENPTGAGFLAVDKNGNIHAADQNYINQTDLVKNPAAAQSQQQPQGGKNDPAHQLANAYKDAFKALTNLVSIVFQGGFQAGQGASGAKDHADNHQPRFGFQPWQGGGIFLHASVSVDISLTLGRHHG